MKPITRLVRLTPISNIWLEIEEPKMAKKPKPTKRKPKPMGY